MLLHFVLYPGRFLKARYLLMERSFINTAIRYLFMPLLGFL